MEILIALTVAATALVITFVLPIISLIRSARIGSQVGDLQTRLGAMEQELRVLRAERPPAAQATAPPAETRPEPAEGIVAPPPPGDAAAIEIAAIDAVLVAVPAEAGPPAPEVPPVPAAAASGHGESAGEPAGDARVPAAPPLPDSEDWVEAAIGGRLLLYAGALAFVLGVAFFLKYAFDRNWITEWMRIAIGLAVGGSLATGGIRLARRGYAGYGQMLTGAGLAVLYLSIYAAYSFYALIGNTPAFALLFLVTAAAAWLSDAQRSQAMAVMAVGGGFLTPFLVGSDTDAQMALFTYVALLVAGTMYLAHRRSWPLLNVLSYAATVLTIAAWASQYYASSKYLRTTLFLSLFCGMFLVILHEARQRRSTAATASAVILASAPVLYHISAVVLLFNHGVALLVYLIALTLAGLAWAIRAPRAWARALLWAAALLPLLAWMGEHTARVWVLPSAVTLGAIFLLHLVAQFDRVFRHDDVLSPLDLLLVHLNGLGVFLGVYVLLEDRALAWIPNIGLGLAVLHVLIARQLRTRDLTGALHALAVAFTLLAAAVAVQLDGAWLTAAWAAEGAGVFWIGLTVRRPWFRAGGIALLALAVWRWLTLSLPGTPAVFHLVLNETFLLGLWLLVLLYACAWLYHRATPPLPDRAPWVATLLVSASVLTVILLSAETAAYWRQEGMRHADATFASGVTLSILWAAYAGVLVAIGIRRGYAPIRYFSIALFALTIGKVFLVDLSDLEGIYRVLGLLVVGGILLVVSFLYQRTTGRRSRPGIGTNLSGS